MSEPVLAVLLRIADREYAVGEPIAVGVEVRNVSTQPLWMVGVLDGSEVGFRYPHYRPEITGPEPLPPPELAECGMVAPLRAQEFRRLDPGAGFDPTAAVDGAAYQRLMTFDAFRPPRPGRYQLHLLLSTESANPDDWLGVLEYPGKEQVLERLSGVPRLRVEATPVTVSVR